MTSPSESFLPSSAALTVATLGVPGVKAVFPASSATALVTAVGAIVGSETPPLPQVQVLHDQESVSMAARIATDGAGSTPDIARAVADALLCGAGTPAAAVSVQVAHIRIE